jgi:hypothetical protein
MEITLQGLQLFERPSPFSLLYWISLSTLSLAVISDEGAVLSSLGSRGRTPPLLCKYLDVYTKLMWPSLWTLSFFDQEEEHVARDRCPKGGGMDDAIC